MTNSLSPKCRIWLFGLLLLAATLTIYQSAWKGGFIWDDDQHLTRPEMRSLAGLRDIWTRPGTTPQYYPVVHSVFWAEYALWGDSPLGYHLVSLLLHVICGLLLWKILRRLEVKGAWLAAAIFVLHPVQVESAAWLTEIKNTLSGAFYLGAALVYLRFDSERKRTSYAIALGLFLLGLMSKSVIATLPAALLVVFWWKRGTLSWKRDVVPLIPFFVVGIVAGLFTVWVERKFVGAEGAQYEFTLVERTLIAGRAVWFYLASLFYPVNLNFIYSRWNISTGVWWQFLFPTAVLLTLVVFYNLRHRWRGLLAGALFFVGTLFPALGFFNVYPFRYSFVADHFQYLACIGPIVLAAAAISIGFGALAETRGTRFLQFAFCGLLLVTLGILSYRQCAMYADIDTLWRTVIQKNPGCWMAYHNQAYVFLRKGELDKAIPELQKAVEINPDFVEGYCDLGAVYAQQGKPDEAMAYYQKALEINPGYPETHYNLANLLASQRRSDEAMTHYQKALELKPNHVEALSNLGALLFRQRRMTEAIDCYRKALRLRPRSPGLQNNLAWVLVICPDASLRNGAEAVELALQASRFEAEENPAILHTLAAAYAEAGRFPEAVKTAQQAVELAEAAGNTSLAEALRNELQLYQANKPLTGTP